MASSSQRGNGGNRNSGSRNNGSRNSASRGGSSRGRDEYREPRRGGYRDEYDEPRRGGSRDEYDVPRSSRGSYNDGRNTGVKNGGSKGKKSMSKKRKARKRRRIIMFTVEMVALVVLAVVLWAVLKQTSIQKINVNEEDIVINDTVENNTAMKGYRNIALFGIDARNDNLDKGNRSDTIMIASINQDTGEVKLCSVYRDTYMNLGNDKYSKCNAAYAAGGPKQAIDMLNMNLDMNITNYISIGFEGLIETIDSLGGIQIDVKEDEIKHLNNYQASMFSTETKEKLTDNYVKVTQPGLQTLNGLQATAYCRIRYTAGDDFKRAERQRTVLLACFEKAKTASVSTLNSILDSVMPHVATNLNTAEMLEVLGELTKYKVVATDGFPFETNRVTGKVGKAGSCVIPTSLEDNVVLLHKFFFEQEEYTPSPSVKSYSAIVSRDTGR